MGHLGKVGCEVRVGMVRSLGQYGMVHRIVSQAWTTLKQYIARFCVHVDIACIVTLCRTMTSIKHGIYSGNDGAVCR